jgi:hypothetical protein
MSAAHFREAAELGGMDESQKIQLRLVKLFNKFFVESCKHP